MCAMEAAAYIAGESHSDKPECVSPAIAAFMIAWNDGLPDDTERDRLLKPLLPLTLHTKTTITDETTRSYMAFDWLVRVHTPAWLDAAKLSDHAKALRSLPELTNAETALAVQQTLGAARAAAGAAARDAARAAAWAAARAAAWAAARDAARDAAWAAAGAALQPTVTLLQESAVELVKRMCAVGEVTERQMIQVRLEEVLATEAP